MYLTKKNWCWFWFPECGGCDPDATGPRLSWPRGHRASNPAPHHNRQQRSGSNSLHFLSHKQSFIFTKHFVTYHRSLLKKNHRNNTTISLFRNSKGLGYWKSQMCIYKEGADWSSPGQWRGRTKHHSGTLQQGFGECGCGHLRQ